MAVVKYTPIEWQMDNLDSIRQHVKQFHEKLQEVGLRYIQIGDTPINFETLPVTMITGTSTTYSEKEFVSITYKMPKGTGDITYTAPDESGAVSVDSFSPILSTDLYLRFNWCIGKANYISPTTNTGCCLTVNLQVCRDLDFITGLTATSIASQLWTAVAHGTTANNRSGSTSIIGDSVISLSREGLNIIHGLHKTLGGLYGSASPRTIIQLSITVTDDQNINIHTPNNRYEWGSTIRGAGTLNEAFKVAYSLQTFDSYNIPRSFTRPNTTNFYFRDINKYNSNGQVQLMNCYVIDGSGLFHTNPNLYSLVRSELSGDIQVNCYYNNMVVNRTIFIHLDNPMTPGASTTSATYIDYNREYGHILEYAPMVGATY